jgi:hypothetical protein
MPLPPWLADQPHKDNWQTVAKLRKQAEDASAAPAPEGSVDVLTEKIAALAEQKHDF